MNAAGSLNNKRIKPITVYDHLFPESREKLQTIMKVLTFCHDHRGKGLSLASSAGGSE